MISGSTGIADITELSSDPDEDFNEDNVGTEESNKKEDSVRNIFD